MAAPKPPTPAALARTAKRAVPTPGPAPAPSAPPGSGDDESVVVDEREAATWGRVADDGTVFVRDAAGSEREVGQYAVDLRSNDRHEEALAFFTRRYAALATEVELLDRRVRSGSTSPDEAADSIRTVREQITDANAVGNLGALGERLDALQPLIDAQREERRAERKQRVEEARARKEQIVVEAEALAAGRDWRNGSNRLRDLLEEWKTLQRVDRTSSSELWHRFSAARTTYSKARKAHFAELDEKRGTAKAAKERLIKEAEALSDSTDWGPTSTKYRDLMNRWKEVGPAARGDDDKLWKRFRAAQDTFFSAREAANEAQDAEFEKNAEVKDALLVEARALLPTLRSGGNIDAAKRSFRDLADRWEAAGKVPRSRMRDLEAGIREVEQALRKAEDAKWRASDPEKSARADDMVGKLEKAVADLEADLERARAAGDEAKVKRIEGDLESRRSFLDMARRTAEEFG